MGASSDVILSRKPGNACMRLWLQLSQVVRNVPGEFSEATLGIADHVGVMSKVTFESQPAHDVNWSPSFKQFARYAVSTLQSQQRIAEPLEIAKLAVYLALDDSP